jgi:selenocysteine lyase/cysteine desulfurase
MTLPPEANASGVDERTALVATSRVFFTSGYLQDIRAVADIAHKHGAYLLVDDYQGTGQIPLNVVALDIDVLVTGSLKWLMGGPGLAFLYVKKELLPSLHPSSVGWFGHQNQLQFDPLSFVEKSSAGRFEMGTPALAALYAAKVALEMIMEVGVERIQAHNAFLVNYLVERARSVGLRVRVPEVPEQRSAIVLFEVENPATAEEKLQAQNFVRDARAGSLRVAPHFFNLTDEMDRFVETLSRTQRGYKHFSY